MNFINEYFDLPQNCHFDSFSSGYMNETWRVSNNGHNLYALRKYNPSRTLSEIECEHQGLMLLKEMFGDRIAAPLESQNNNTIEKIDGFYYSLFPFIEGQVPKSEDSQHTQLAARTLAVLHKKLWNERHLFESISSSRQPVSMERFFSSDQMYKSLVSELSEDEITSLKISPAMFSNLERKVKSALKRLAPYIKDKHLIHGDFGSSNLLINVESNSISAILDWEEMRWDSPLFEIASVVNFCEMDHEGTGELFLAEYIAEIQRTNHPKQNTIIESINYLDDAILCANYFELNLMIESKHFEAEYIQFLCQAMA